MGTWSETRKMAESGLLTCLVEGKYPDGTPIPASGGSGGTGDVVGPASSVDENIAVYDGTTGKLLKDFGTNISDITDNTTHRGLTNNPHSVTAAQASAVATTGDETVAGIKTFSSFPITPSSAPTTDYQTANKKYVDDNGGGQETYDVIVSTWAELKTAIETSHYNNIAFTGTLTATSDITFPVDAAGAGMAYFKLSGLSPDDTLDFAGLYQMIINGSTSDYQHIDIGNITIINPPNGKGAIYVADIALNNFNGIYFHDWLCNAGGSSRGLVQFGGIANGQYHQGMFERIQIDGFPSLFYDQPTNPNMSYQATFIGVRTQQLLVTGGTKNINRCSFYDCKTKMDTSNIYRYCNFTNCLFDTCNFGNGTTNNKFVNCKTNNTDITWTTELDEYKNYFVNLSRADSSDFPHVYSLNQNVFYGTVTSTEAVGDLVYVKSDGTYEQADGTDTTKVANAVIVSKPSSTEAILKQSGKMGGYTGLTIGGKVWLDTTAGGVTQTKPVASGNLQQCVGVAFSATEIDFNIVPTDVCQD